MVHSFAGCFTWPSMGMVWIVAATVAGRAGGADAHVFDRDSRPILSDNCFARHGPDAGQRLPPHGRARQSRAGHSRLTAPRAPALGKT